MTSNALTTSSDSLHRHLVRHGAEFKPTPSGRSKKACIACHKGKIKCDGIEPCSKCASKGSACVYEKQPTQPRQNEDAILPPFSKLGLIDWASMKVQKASEDPAKSESGFELDDPTTLIRPTVSEEAEKAHLDSYFRYFHHRWPIVHRPSYMSSTHLQPLLCAMNMIGALESGNGRSKMYGMVMQDYLMHRMPPLLVNSHIPLFIEENTHSFVREGKLRRTVSKEHFRRLYAKQLFL
jgi:hypothetical protein